MGGLKSSVDAAEASGASGAGARADRVMRVTVPGTVTSVVGGLQGHWHPALLNQSRPALVEYMYSRIVQFNQISAATKDTRTRINPRMT